MLREALFGANHELNFLSPGIEDLREKRDEINRTILKEEEELNYS